MTTLAVVTPWYPTPAQPGAGSFVRAHVEVAADLVERVDVIHLEAWLAALPGMPGRLADRGAAVAQRMFDMLAARTDPQPVEVERWTLLRFPALARSRTAFASLADAHERSLAVVRRGSPLDADVVHAHVGLPSGWAASRHLAPGVPLVVTEHASYLDQILAQPDAKARYDGLLGKVRAMLCVSGVLRDQLAEAFPHHAGKLRVVPNPLDIKAFVPGERPVTGVTRMLCVGSLIPRKGVDRLLAAVSLLAREDHDVSLTVAGDGGERARLEALAEELGVAGRVRWLGAVAPAAVADLYREHDLLVSASYWETFGMTPVEAVACGLPVLATDSGGAGETMAALAGGRAELVARDADAEAIADGWLRLAERIPADPGQAAADAAAARAVMVDACGPATVADALRSVYGLANP